VERRRLERSSASLQEFLESLRLEVTMRPAAPAQYARVAQLTQRTNQMNVTPVRRGEQDIGELLRGGAECLAVEVRDRFGDYGLTGVMLYRVRDGVLAVEAFLLSCRAMGRGVEHRMLARLGEIALERGAHSVEIPFVPAARNRPALLFLESTGGAFRADNGNGTRFRLPAAFAAGVVYKPEGKPAPASAEPSRAPKSARSPIDYSRIATDLRAPEALVALLRRRLRGAAAPPPNAAAPRNELESQLAAVWADLLKVPAVGLRDNFFDLGGHSLLVVQMLSHVSHVYGVDLSMEVVYNGNFTVESLAKAIELKQIEGAGEYQDLLKELEGLSDDEVRALLAQEEQAGQTGGVV
jgi:acyl carrier protein